MQLPTNITRAIETLEAFALGAGATIREYAGRLELDRRWKRDTAEKHGKTSFGQLRPDLQELLVTARAVASATAHLNDDAEGRAITDARGHERRVWRLAMLGGAL